MDQITERGWWVNLEKSLIQSEGREIEFFKAVIIKKEVGI